MSDYKSYAYREVDIKINDPHGQKVYETKLTTNQNGSINGSFEIPKTENWEIIIFMFI